MDMIEISCNFTAMRCLVKAFGIARDIISGREVVIEVPDKTTVAELKSRLLTDYPRLRALTSLYIAVNAEYAPDDQILSEGDEIALIPPVSGG